MSPLSKMNQWYQTAVGQQLLSLELAALTSYFSQWRGEYGLQIGGSQHGEHLQAVNTVYSYFLSDEMAVMKQQMICASLTQLPLLPDALDFIVVPHGLEWRPDAKSFLLQIERSLVDEGYLVVCHFNPWSVAGVSRAWHKRCVPWTGRWFGSYRRIRRCFSDTGMMCVHRQSMGYLAELQCRLSGRSKRLIETLGRCLCSRAGMTELTVWQKKGLAMTPHPSKMANHRWVEEGGLTPTSQVPHKKRIDHV